ncbi:hypothetical protein ACOJCM_01730 [Billgrantia sp. LNSP4103-1]|uniref:hypothetical protein n=1 Tax=Billgrantia sp. LNSP4103-1 TaxID=3410266 RepID=UPI00403F3517
MWGKAMRLSWPLGLMLALPAMANPPEEPETIGTMSGLLNGDEREWVILRQGNDANATFTDTGERVVIDLIGFAEPEMGQFRDSLSLSITLVEGEVIHFDLLHPIGAASMPPVFTSENADVRLNLETFEVEGSQAHVAGRVEGILALQQSLDEPPTLEEGIGISVGFDAQASRIEY